MYRAVRRIVLATAAICFVAITIAHAETRAVLIGVSDYDNSIGLADLRGPRNDVVLLSEVLRERGVDNIEILADGVEGATAPTYAAITAALAAQARKARPGDLVILHFSGHGTRQIDKNGDEADGYDEVFLPADVARAQEGVIPNALTDEEIGKAVRAIRAAGADVWTIMDFCHAGTGLRSGGAKTASRYVDPGALGIERPSAAPETGAHRWFTSNRRERSLPGGLVAFYAAQADEVAREVDFGGSSETGDAGWYGLFTSRIAARLRSSPNITYQQMFQAVLDDMNASTVPGGARLQTPFREGTMLDAAVLGGADTIGIRQYAVSFDEMSAGRVHGITMGTIVALVADAAASVDAVIGYAQVEEVTSLTAFLRPVDDTCRPDAKSLCAPSGNLPETARFARIAIVPGDTSLRFSPVKDLETSEPLGPEDHPLVARFHDAVRQGISDLEVEISPSDYQVEVGLRGDMLWFGRRLQVGPEPVGVAWSGEETDLLELFRRIAKAEQLAATMRTIAESASPLMRNPLNVSIVVQRSDPNLLARVSGRMAPVRECRNVQRRSAYTPAEPLGTPAELKQCDRLQTSAKGALGGSYDVNRIYIDSQFCMSAEYQRIDGARVANAIGGPVIVCSDCPGGYSAGAERMYVLVSKAKSNADQLNLESVVSNCAAPGTTRNAGRKSLASLITRFGKAKGTRGSFGGMAPDDVWVETFEWSVLPRAVALARKSRPSR